MSDLGTIVGASPLDADDTAYYTFTDDTDGDTRSYALGDTPTDFQTMDSCSYTTIARLRDAPGNDTYTLRVRIINGATILAAADSGGTFQTVAVITSNSDQTNGPTAFTYVNTSANKATWDGASVEIQQGYSKTAGFDVNAIQADYFALTGTYTRSAQTVEGALSLGVDLGDSNAALKLTDSAITLTNYLGIQFTPIQILQGLVTLTHNLGVTNSADAVMIAAATLGITLNQAQANDALMIASVSLDHSLGQTLAGGKVFEEAVALAIVLTEAAAGNIITSASVAFKYGLRCVTLGPELMTDPGFDNPGEWSLTGAIAVTGSQLVADNAETTRFASHAAPGATVGRIYRISMDTNQSWIGTNWLYRVIVCGFTINIGNSNQADFEQLRLGMYRKCISAVSGTTVTHIGGSGYTVYGTSDNFSIKQASIDAGLVADASLVLGHSLTQAQLNTSIMQALLSLGITLQQIQEGTVPAAIIEAALSLGINLSKSQSGGASAFASYADSINLSQSQTNIATAEADLSLNFSLGSTVYSIADMQALLALGVTLEQVQTGAVPTATIEAALALGIILRGPEGTLGNELNADSGFDQPSYWE